MDFDALRRKMVEQQIKGRGVTDKSVIRAMLSVPRHKFVPEELQDQAYDDRPLNIGNNQTISQPYMVAAMTEALKLKREDTVFEIGTGSGYQAAICAEIAAHVLSVERIEYLSRQAQKRLTDLGFTNVECLTGDGSGIIAQSDQSFDAIIITAGLPGSPGFLFHYLKAGGTMVAPVGDRAHQVLKRFTKMEHEIKEEDLFGCVFVPLIGKHGWPL